MEGSSVALEASSGHSEVSFSRQEYEGAFSVAYRSFERARHAFAGVSPVQSARQGSFDGDRVLKWEAAAGSVCLKEIWLGHNLCDNAICLRLGDATQGFPLAVHVESVLGQQQGVDVDIIICFLMPNRVVHKLRLSSSSADADNGLERSVLADLVQLRQGDLIDLSLEREINSATYPIRKIPETSSLTSWSWHSSNSLVLGLSQGGLLAVEWSPNGAYEEFFLHGMASSSGLVDALKPIAQWWQQGSGGGGDSTPAEIIAITSFSTGVIALDNHGALTVWDLRSRSCVARSNIALALSDLQQEQIRVSGGKICLQQQDSGSSSILAAVALEYQTSAEAVSAANRNWKIAMFSVARDSGAHAFLGVVAPLTASGSPGWSHYSLIDMQFSGRITDGVSCLNTLWRLDGSTALYATHFSTSTVRLADGSNGLASKSEKLVSNRDLERMDKWKEHQEEAMRIDESTYVDEVTLLASMLQKIFYPGRFSARTIEDVLVREIPFEFQFLPEDLPETNDFAGLVECVVDACTHWGARSGSTKKAFLQFINLCHSRSLSDDECGNNCLLAIRQTIQSKYSCFLAHRDHISLVCAEPVTLADLVAAGPGIRTAVPKASSVIGDKVSHFLKDAKNDAKLSYLRLNMRNHFTTNATLGKSFFQSVAADLAGLAEEAVRTLSLDNPQFSGAASIAEQCGVMSASFRSEFDDLALHRESEMYAGANFPLRNLHALVADISRTAIHNVCSRSQNAAVVFAVFQRLGGPKAQAIELNFSTAVFDFIYSEFLLWLDSVRPTDDGVLGRAVDLTGNFPNSHALSLASSASRHQQSRSSSNSNASVLGSFFRDESMSISCMQATEGSAWLPACMRRCLFLLRPSCMGDLTKHLVRHAQYACLGRLASFLELRIEVCHGGSQQQGAFISFCRKLVRSRISALGSLGAFYECLRRQAIKSQVLGDEDKGRLSMNSDFEKSECLKSHEALLLSAPPALGFGHSGGSSLEDSRGLAFVTFFQGGTQVTDIIDLDAIYCARDVLQKMLNDEQSPFAALVGKRRGLVDEEFLSSALVQNLSRVAFLSDVTDLFRRARVVLPTSIGSEISLNGGNAFLLPALYDLQNYCSDVSSLLLLDRVQAVFVTAWNRVFNSSLESLNFDAAWKAVVDMLSLELGATRQQQESAVENSASQWLVCLHSLVSQACDTGHLDWLCSVPDDVQQGGVCLADEVIKELDRLAKSSGINSNESSHRVDYYDCLFAFLLTRESQVQAAHSLLALSIRFDNNSPSRKARSLAAVTCALASQSVPLAQRYLTVTKRDRRKGESVFYSVEELELWFLLETARERLKLPTSPSLEASSVLQECEECVAALCHQLDLGSVTLALDIALRSEVVARASQQTPGTGLSSSRSAYTSSSLERAVQGLVVFCVAALVAPSTARVDAAFLPFSTESTSSDGLIAAIVTDVLTTHDSAARNWALHATALRCALGFADSDKLVDAILASFAACSKNNQDGLLTALISTGHLAEACSVATRMLAAIDHRKPAVFVPYSSLDHLMRASASRADAKEALRTLSSALEIHFEKTLCA